MSNSQFFPTEKPNFKIQVTELDTKAIDLKSGAEKQVYALSAQSPGLKSEFFVLLITDDFFLELEKGNYPDALKDYRSFENALGMSSRIGTMRLLSVEKGETLRELKGMKDLPPGYIFIHAVRNVNGKEYKHVAQVLEGEYAFRFSQEHGKGGHTLLRAEAYTMSHCAHHACGYEAISKDSYNKYDEKMNKEIKQVYETAKETKEREFVDDPVGVAMRLSNDTIEAKSKAFPPRPSVELNDFLNRLKLKAEILPAESIGDNKSIKPG